MHEPYGFHNFIWFILVGGLAGWLASLLVLGGGMGLLADIVVGIAGAAVGGFMADYFNWYVYGFWGVLGVSILGAVILLLVFKALAGSRRKG